MSRPPQSRESQSGPPAAVSGDRKARDVGSERRRRQAARWRIGAWTFSAAGHLALLAALIAAKGPPPAPPPPAPITVELADWPSPVPAPKPPAGTPTVQTPAAAPATPTKLPPQKSIVRRTRESDDIDSLISAQASTTSTGVELTGAELAGAGSADSGAGGGSCDMARSIQRALRRDPLVQAAVASLGGKAIKVWNGDWVQSGGEDGKGLAAVREAIMWEVAFSPKACRSEPVHGLVLLSLNGSGGSARLALGSGVWRWSDLLRPTPTIEDR
ncbi:MAG: hypothetical protein JO127_06640 [Caulobacteraceae bacterium]|nr:hypothetical protein [Caulobacteraceae bacterium]